MDDATTVIERLALAPHPEGGWYRETWRSPDLIGGRAIATAILFLLEDGKRSQWHRVDATEIWLWHAGSPLTLSIAPSDEGPVQNRLLGGNPLSGTGPQYIIAPNVWQAAEARAGWSLVSCIVAPGFQFEGFTLAPPGWSPGRGAHGKR